MPEDEIRTLIEVPVLLTVSEYEKLRSASMLTAEGTVRAALREKAGMQEKPYGAGKAHRVLDVGGYEAVREP